MSIFKPGDRIRLKREHLAKMRAINDIVGTIRDVIDGLAYVVLDNKLVSYDEDGNQIYFQEGHLDKPLEPYFEVIEESDWASMWDDAAED